MTAFVLELQGGKKNKNAPIFIFNKFAKFNCARLNNKIAGQ